MKTGSANSISVCFESLAKEFWFTGNVYFRLISMQIQSQLQYRLAFLFDIIAAAIIVSLFFIALVLVFQRFEAMAGWRLEEVAFLYGLVEVVYGLLLMIFSGFEPSIFQKHVRHGTFDQLLLRPINPIAQVLGGRFVLRRLGNLIQGIAIFWIALHWVQIDWNWPKLIYLPVVLMSMVCFFGGILIIGSTMTFWMTQTAGLTELIARGSRQVIAYPMHIYPGYLRAFFTFFVPAIFLNYYPALYFLNKPDPFGAPQMVAFLAPFIGLGILFFSIWFWQQGIRHYQSTGS